MIKIRKYISNISFCFCRHKDKEEPREIVDERIKQECSNCDLNDISVSLITNMSDLLHDSDFYDDIYRCDVSNVDDMRWMFHDCPIEEEYKSKSCQKK